MESEDKHFEEEPLDADVPSGPTEEPIDDVIERLDLLIRLTEETWFTDPDDELKYNSDEDFDPQYYLLSSDPSL